MRRAEQTRETEPVHLGRMAMIFAFRSSIVSVLVMFFYGYLWMEMEMEMG